MKTLLSLLFSLFLSFSIKTQVSPMEIPGLSLLVSPTTALTLPLMPDCIGCQSYKEIDLSGTTWWNWSSGYGVILWDNDPVDGSCQWSVDLQQCVQNTGCTASYHVDAAAYLSSFATTGNVTMLVKLNGSTIASTSKAYNDPSGEITLHAFPTASSSSCGSSSHIEVWIYGNTQTQVLHGEIGCKDCVNDADDASSVSDVADVFFKLFLGVTGLPDPRFDMMVRPRIPSGQSDPLIPQGQGSANWLREGN